jgi:hypothetical protein
MDTKCDPSNLSDSAGAYGSTFRHVTSNTRFDGSTNLTLGGGTLLIPAPSTDPRGETVLEIFYRA